MLKRLLSLMLVCVSIGLAQQDFAGNWEGVIGPDSLELGILVRFDEADGALTGTIDIPQQQASGLPLQIVDVSADRATFIIEGVPGEATFMGRLAGDVIEGDFEQGGQRLPFVLNRATATEATEAEASVPVVETLLGNWQGVIGEGIIDLQIGLQFADEAGALIGRIAIPAQGFDGVLAIQQASESQIVASIVGIPGEPTFFGEISGDTITGTFTQGGQELPFFLERTDTELTLRRPQEPERPFPYVEEEVTVQSGDVTLAGTLTLPEGEGPFAAVLFISGSGAQDRDEALLGHRPFLVLSDAITRAGLATLRLDDRGVGGSTGDLSQASYDDLVADILAGVDYLKSRPEIDAGHIGLFGHSEGGYLAPLAASQSDDIDFVVMMAGPAVSGLRVLELQNRLIFSLAGASEEDIQAQLAFLRESAQLLEREAYDELEVLVRERILSEFAALPEGERPSEEEQQMIIEAQVANVASPYFRSFVLYDPTPALRQLNVPVLAFFGNLDIQVPPVQSVGPLRAALRLAGNDDVTIEVFDGLNHLLQPAMTGAIEEYAQIETTIAPEVLDLVTTWLTERFVD
jgi:pimeloyl-ACP methyl ester carboxylesterase